MVKEKKPVHRVQMTEGKRNIVLKLLEKYDIQTAENIQNLNAPMMEITGMVTIVNRQIVDTNQAEMLHKIPRQPEVFNNNTSIKDTRTSFVDVFAAASQIEIEEDEE